MPYAAVSQYDLAPSPFVRDVIYEWSLAEICFTCVAVGNTLQRKKCLVLGL